ncbi:MAG: flagellar basal body L-ring protein FlgH [Schwartzia sp.]|nr:flagellar basal body L-ring protein FlgH [Schwartzia sp. (in: firmicutes)]MBR1761496.1 flagellar basal body L-ring protein FlgH [Schwartzia sp. (in: firmicutes)]MBR1886687.1 flagellar basal body L-ring protein FlgH [Schwartzia sp. (in: firmicutes)]
MKKHGRLLMAAGLSALLLATAVPASAQSLWADSKGHTESTYFADRKARDVGDILTIVISETATTSATKSGANSKSGNVNMNAGVGVFDFLNSIFPASISGSDDWKADGSASSTNRASGRVTVTVVDVEPNGNMVIEGTQSIWQNKNEHKITLRGVVRRDDVSYNNTVPSSQVADATIRFDGKGPLNSKQRQGILTQIFNILF